MKLKLSLSLLLSLIIISASAQSNDVKFNIGIPLGNYGKFDHNFLGSDVTNYPSFIMQLEKKWQEELSIGAYLGYTGQKHEYNFGHNKVSYNYYRLGSVLTYELNEWLSSMNLSPGYNIEMYASIKAGFSIEKKQFTSTEADSNSNPYYISNKSNDLLLDLGFVLGTRYYFSKQFGIFSELGWGNGGFLTIGTTFNL